MFYCRDCAKKNDWPWDPWGLARFSHGPCEMCRTVGKCVDVPSYALPVIPRKKK